jgi:hypothetical protein
MYLERNIMTKKITILWGSDRDPNNKETYKFDNEEQFKYFMMGVDEGNGWLEYEVIDE